MALRKILYPSQTSTKGISLLFKNGLTPVEHSARYSCLLRKNLFLTNNGTVTLNRQISVDSKVKKDHPGDGISAGQSDGERKTTKMEKQLKKQDRERQTGGQRLNEIEVKFKECTSLASALKMLKQNSRILRNNYGNKEKDEQMGRMAKFLQELHHGKEMTPEDFKMFMRVKSDVRIFHYHDYEFCEKLQDFVLNKNTEDTIGGIAKVINHCYLLNHACNPKIISLFHEVFEKNVNSLNLNKKIFDLGTLCKVNVYPEEHITTLFSSENRAEIANLQKENEAVRAVFNVLNRSIILNCPHLKVPFIGLTRELQTMPILMEDLKKSLDNVLGDGFYKSNTILPYNIHLGVEAFLTSDGKAVAYDVGKKMKDPSLQRLGIILLSRRSFCLLSDEPVGNIHTIIKHLQKLNYKAILILEKEWETLKTDEDKNNYLRGKIFAK